MCVSSTSTSECSMLRLHCVCAYTCVHVCVLIFWMSRRAVCKKFGLHVGRLLLAFLVLSAGMFCSSAGESEIIHPNILHIIFQFDVTLCHSKPVCFLRLFWFRVNKKYTEFGLYNIFYLITGAYEVCHVVFLFWHYYGSSVCVCFHMQLSCPVPFVCTARW